MFSAVKKKIAHYKTNIFSSKAHIKFVKKIFCVFFLFSTLFFIVDFPNVCLAKDNSVVPIMAIVIDDFGGLCSRGVEEMLALTCPLTCAVMPKLENTKRDANLANSHGKEVILHMPMEASGNLPKSWYGSVYIKNSNNFDDAKNLTLECLEDISFCKGLNIHIGSGVCQKKIAMSGVMAAAKQKKCFFLDSVTNYNSVCESCAKETGVPFVKRTEFLEKTGEHRCDYAHNMLIKGANEAKKNGVSVVIGHVGYEGGKSTAKAIANSIEEIEKLGVRLVFLSEAVERISC